MYCVMCSEQSTFTLRRNGLTYHLCSACYRQEQKEEQEYQTVMRDAGLDSGPELDEHDNMVQE